MLRQVIAGLLLLLYVFSFSFVPKSDEQDRYVAVEKLIDQSGSSELDYYLYSSYTSLRGPAANLPSAFGGLYKEEMYSHSCWNIFSPPPERTTL